MIVLRQCKRKDTKMAWPLSYALTKGAGLETGTPLYVIRIHHAKDVCIANVCREEGLPSTNPFALKSNYSIISFPDLFGKYEIKATAFEFGISPPKQWQIYELFFI